MPEISIEMVTAEFIRKHFLPWRCLHNGPLRKESIGTWEAGSSVPWEALESRNIPFLHKLIKCCPSLPENPYQRKGIGTRLARTLIEWVGQNGWEAVETIAYEELEILYQITGQAGKRFWEKVGFRLVQTCLEEGFLQVGDLLQAMQAEAKARGLELGSIRNSYTMHLETGAYAPAS